ncbi:Probable aggregation factor core protein MAFp3, isoform C [Bathymodiolus heckerae thiotrophic gill symbiont]|nr:Probable aggregation factor core protein MAFp3, isoform C [Bathymodiolus heckerae thiotrophic gill symbiont]
MEIAGASGVTGSDGSVSLANVVLPTGLVYSSCSDGTYTDEATGQATNAPNIRAAVIYSGTGELSLFASPISEISFRLADTNDGDLTTIAAVITTQNAQTATAFGLDGVDITSIIPTDINTTAAANDAANDAAGKFGVVLAAISQMGKDSGDDDSAATIQALVADMRAGNNINIAQAIDNFENNADAPGSKNTGSAGSEIKSSLAISRISNYNGSGTAPILQDYTNAGVIRVTDSNLATVNAQVATASSDDSDTTAKIQTIVDNSIRTIAFDATSSSGLESVRSANLAYTLSVASSKEVTVDYTVTGTATGTETGSGTDYTLVNGTLTLAAGATTGNITIASIIDDALDEGNETVVVTLSNPNNATLGTNEAHTYTITDNDALTIAFDNDSSSGLESVGSANLAYTLSAASSKEVTVDYAVTGTATGSGTDYTLANGTLTLAAGATTGNITIASIIADTIYAFDEGNETVIVTLSNPNNATLGTNTVHTYTIIDNEIIIILNPTIAFNDASSSGAESVRSANLAYTLSFASSKEVTVDYAVTGTATGSGTDYTLINGTLTLTAGATTGNITIASIIDDVFDEGNETVVVTLSNPNNATLGTNKAHTYTITDNDAPTIAFNDASSSGLESVRSANLAYTLSAASSREVTVNYAVTGTATGSGTDYTLINGTLTLAAGATTGNITIASIIDDALDESDETVVVTLSNPDNATLGTNTTHTYTIINNDEPTIAFDNDSSSGAESTNSANLAYTLSAASSQEVTVDYAVTGTATGSGTDYTLINGTLTLTAGATTGNITIASIIDDAFDESNETVVVTLSNPNNATLGTNTAHTYTITDNDVPTIAFNDASSSGTESTNSANLAYTLSTASVREVTVDYAVTGTATGSGIDYTLSNGTLTLAAGVTAGNITIASIINDSELEGGAETVIVTLSNPSNVTLGTNTVHTYTITDSDTVTFEGKTYASVRSPDTGKVWLDRNLGATQVATSSTDSAAYGHLYQWGRNDDGHESRSSATTATLATTITPGTNTFITNGSSPYDWMSADSTGNSRTNAWSNGEANDICPAGFSVPTEDELRADTKDATTTKIINQATAFSSFLKLPTAGYRFASSGGIDQVGSAGVYWSRNTRELSSSFSIDLSILLDISKPNNDFFVSKLNNGFFGDVRANGNSVRCIKN